MNNIIERKKTLEVMLSQRMNALRQSEDERNKLVTEIVQLQSKIELLNELERETSTKLPEQPNI